MIDTSRKLVKEFRLSVGLHSSHNRVHCKWQFEKKCKFHVTNASPMWSLCKLVLLYSSKSKELPINYAYKDIIFGTLTSQFESKTMKFNLFSRTLSMTLYKRAICFSVSRRLWKIKLRLILKMFCLTFCRNTKLHS